MRSAIFLVLLEYIFACTNLIVTKGANKEGYNVFGYNADSALLYGTFDSFPAADHPPNSYVEIYDGDSGNYVGKIPQVAHTENVVGLMNSWQVAFGESTFGGISDLGWQQDGLIDYVSLMTLVLQRSHSAYEAITVLDDLVQTYGYYSGGESFTIGDPNEIWYMELIGKGKHEWGAVWVAIRLPDGTISGHANAARIEKFNWSDTQNVRYSPDVMTFAQDIGRYPLNGAQEDFSFAAAYDTVTVQKARFDDARVWTFFVRALGYNAVSEYEDYALGKNITKRLPLYYPIGNNKKLSVKDVYDLLGDHAEGTVLDPSNDLGAQAYNLPYRWRPLEWSVNGSTYLNERTIGIQQTAYSYLHVMRPNFSSAIGGISWLGMDDSTFSFRIPLYSSIPTLHPSLTELSGSILNFSFHSLFWINSLISNWAYLRSYRDLAPEIHAKRDLYYEYFLSEVAEKDAHSKDLISKNRYQEATVYLTEACYNWTQNVTDELNLFFGYLFAKYMDGNLKVANPDDPFNPQVSFPGYGDKWYERIVDETGNRYQYPTTSKEGENSSRGVMTNNDNDNNNNNINSYYERGFSRRSGGRAFRNKGI